MPKPTSPDADKIAAAVTSLQRRVAATIADMRGRRGLDQAALADLLGITAGHLARMEDGDPGQAATLEVLAEIAETLNFHMTLGVHDREPAAIGAAPDAAQDALAPLETISVSLDDEVQLGAAPDIVLADDVAITIPDEPDTAFLLDDSSAGMTVQKQKDDTFSPGGGDGGFSDGMNG